MFLLDSRSDLCFSSLRKHGYTLDMALTVSDKQLEAIDIERQPVLLVRHSRTKKGYAVMPESVYDHARPLIEFMMADGTTPEHSQTTWTDAKNARRAALIHKKYDSKLSASEERELVTLQEEVCRHQERVAPLRNQVLELIVQALEQRVKASRSRKP